MPRIAFVGPFIYPDSSAVSKHIDGLAEALTLAGATVSICAGDRALDLPMEAQSTSRFLASHVCELPCRHDSKLAKGLRHLSFGDQTIRWLSEQAEPIDLVLQFGGYSPYSTKLLKWCAQNNCPLMINVVEWFGASQLPLGWGGPFHLSNEIALRHYFPKAGNIIVISRYLENYYRSRGCRTIRIPPIIDCGRVVPRLRNKRVNEPLLLVYAGSPGKKDLLDTVLETLFRVNADGVRASLVLVGVSPTEALLQTPLQGRGLSLSPTWLRAIGRVSIERAMEEVRNADFSILFRPKRRYSEAGFPTKVVESLSLGTPLLCNLSSDLGEYLNHGKEALICSDFTVPEITTRLEEAIALGPVDLDNMRIFARNCAEEHFDVRKYAPPLRRFLAAVCQ
jgi:glycosyltransferase involved in cell wall biosynthesis